MHTLNGSRRKGASASREGPSKKTAVFHGNDQPSTDECGSDPVCEDPILPGPAVDEGPSEQLAQASDLANVISPGDPPRLGISSLPLPSNVSLFLNNVSFLGYDWIEGLRKLSLSGQSGPSLPLPMPITPAEAAPGMDAHPVAAITAFAPVPIPSVEEPTTAVLEPDPESCPEESCLSPSESMDSGYFLRSCIKPSSGLGKVTSPVRRGQGRKTNLFKAQSRAKEDLLEGKQQSIEKALRVKKAKKKGRI